MGTWPGQEAVSPPLRCATGAGERPDVGYLLLVIISIVVLLIDFLILYFMFRRPGRPAGLDTGR